MRLTSFTFFQGVDIILPPRLPSPQPPVPLPTPISEPPPEEHQPFPGEISLEFKRHFRRTT